MFLIVEPCDFEGFPPGGQLTMARHLMRAFGPDAALVGFASDDTTPVGQWLERDFAGTRHPFFAFGRRLALAKKPLIPGRLQAFIQLCRYRDAILSIGRLPVFTQSPEALFAVARWPVPSICHRFPGTANSLAISRYPLVRSLAPLYELALFQTLRHADIILAAADHESIQSLTARSGTLLQQSRVIHFPTRVDTTVFAPRRAAHAVSGFKSESPTSESAVADAQPAVVPDVQPLLAPRSSLLAPTFITSGRLSHIKGWPLLLDAFEIVLCTHPKATLTFVGDGEDRPRLSDEITRRNLQHAVTITGLLPPEQVAASLQSADVYVSASHTEGWSLSMLEALACGKPIVTTQVSGAKEMIIDAAGGAASQAAGAGTLARPLLNAQLPNPFSPNGFILPTRDPAAHAEAMLKSLALKDAARTSIAIAARYSTATLKDDLLALWPAALCASSASSAPPR